MSRNQRKTHGLRTTHPVVLKFCAPWDSRQPPPPTEAPIPDSLVVEHDVGEPELAGRDPQHLERAVVLRLPLDPLIHPHLQVANRNLRLRVQALGRAQQGLTLGPVQA